MRGVLVSAQLALSLILLLGAWLFLRSLQRLGAADPGYDANEVLTGRVTLLPNKTPAGNSAFYREALNRVRSLPGVRDAAWAAGLPLTVAGGSGSFQIRGRAEKAGEAWPHGLRRYVTPGFLNVLRVPLRRGRFFTEADRENTEPVCVIDERLARQYWPTGDPIGGEIVVDGRRARIVGVIGHISQGLPSAGEVKGEYIFPLYQQPSVDAAIAIRTTAGDPLALAAGLREAIRSAERTAELGLRLALGATRGQVLRMMLSQGLRLATAGVCTGLAITAVAMPFLRSRILFETRDLDAWLIGGKCAGLTFVVILAMYLPAYRATTIDPAIALRRQ